MTLHHAFAAALATRLADASQHEAMALVPAYRLLLDLSTGPDPGTSGESPVAEAAQPAAPADAAGSSATAPLSAEADASGGSQAASADARADSSEPSQGEPESTTLFVAEVMLKALRSSRGPAAPSSPVEGDQQASIF